MSEYDHPLLDKWRFYLKDYESPDSFINWGYYSLISSVLQRRVWMDEEPRQLYANQYVLFCGPPATGKTMIIAVNASFLRHTEFTMFKDGNNLEIQQKIPTAPDSITLEALTQKLSGYYQRRFKYKKEDGSSALYVHSSLQFLCEELGVLLRKHTDDMINVLIQGYDSRQLERVTKWSGSDAVKNICLGILAGTTPKWVSDGIKFGMFDTGFLSRFITIYEPKPRFYREHPGFNAEQRVAWQEIFDHIKKVSEEFGQCKLSAEAASWKKEYYESGGLVRDRVNLDSTLDHYYGRKHANWKKMCMILHFSEPYTEKEITLTTTKRALKILNDAEAKMHLAYTSVIQNKLFEQQQRMFKFVEVGPTVGVFKGTLVRNFSSQLNIDEINSCLNTLVEGGQLTRTNDVFKLAKQQPIVDK